ncbi:MAG: DUF3299 domain-containing protein, partial [Verrucomicrobiales bacterium]|nr:DUF3299 domain-containing protein [Verrucomicrobiales bacterium]
VPIDFTLLDEVRPLDLIEMNLEFPESLLSLEGKRVQLTGFMAPYDSLNDMRRCMIVPSYVGCTFCSPPSLTQVVYVQQKEQSGGEFPFIEPPSRVSGILRLSEGEEMHAGHQEGFVYVIDDAVVTPYLGDDAPERAPGHGGRNSLDPSAHANAASGLKPVAFDVLTKEVSELRGLSPLKEIQFERVPMKQLKRRVREDMEWSYPLESREALVSMFHLLGFFDIPDSDSDSEWDWENLMISLSLHQRIAWVGEKGEVIEVLDSAATDDPFTRLELVKYIADALVRQHFATARPPAELFRDSNRALEGVRQGNKQLTAFRYARQRNISPASRPPEDLFTQFPKAEQAPPLVDLWYWLPWETGPFFVESRTGATKDLSHIDELFEQPPVSTVELFRPGRYRDRVEAGNEVRENIVHCAIRESPVIEGRLGIGGLIPWLMGSLPLDQAKGVSGRALADRYSLWNLPDCGYVLLLDTSWPDGVTARIFLENVPAHPVQIVQDNPAAPHSVRIIRAETEEGLQLVVTELNGE